MKIYFMLVLCVLFWSGNFILGRYIKDDLEPIQLGFYRWLGVLIIFLPYLIQKRVIIFKVLKTHTFILLFLSFLGIAFFNTILYVGLQDTTATNALLINSSVPILIILLSMLILKTKVTTWQIAGILFSMVGVIYLAIHGDLNKLLQLTFNKGDIWVIASSLSWALYSVLLKFKPKNFEAFFPTTVLLGTMMLLIVFLYQDYSIFDIKHVSLQGKLVIAYTVLFPSIISFYLWHEGIAEIGADKTGQFTHLMPVFGTILAYIFLDEKLYIYQIIGFSFVVFGIYLSLFKQKNIC